MEDWDVDEIEFNFQVTNAERRIESLMALIEDYVWFTLGWDQRKVILIDQIIYLIIFINSDFFSCINYCLRLIII